MLILICLILIFVGLLIFQQIYRRYSSNVIYKIPGPPTIPFFGNALALNDTYEGQWKTVRRYMYEYYPTVCIWLLSDPVVFIRHPDDIKVLIKSKSNIDKAHKFYSMVRKYGNGGIVTSGGTKWQERRRLMNQAFLRNSLQHANEFANKYAELFIQKLLGLEDKSIVNILPLTLKYAVDVICGSAMGFDLYEIFEPHVEEFVEALDHGLALVMYRTYRPFLTDWIINLLPVGKKMVHYSEIIKSLTRMVVEERTKYHKKNGIDLHYDEFINGLKNIDSTDTKVKPSFDVYVMDMLCIYYAKGLMDEQGIIEELETLLAAGYETTGLSSAYALLLLAENEKEQSLAREEVVHVMKKCGNNQTISDLQNLQYLDRCIKEALRLFPSVPMAGRKLVEDTQFSKYVIPRNTDVFMCFYDLHRDPKYWPEPTKFNPDRFLPEFSKDQYPYTYLPFSGGLRSCIGQKHSIAEIKVLIAHVLYNFYLEPVELTCNIAIDMNIALRPSSNNLSVKFVKILRDN